MAIIRGVDSVGALFVGPTGTAEAMKLAADAGFVPLPPAARGDVAALLGSPPGTIVLVDGRFHERLSVGHVEIGAAIDAGWTVWGLGSMGAIRAYEMRHLGMKGFGSIYGHFLAEHDFQDDEVALLHLDEPPYLQASEPLVHLRYFILALERASGLDSCAAADIVRDLKSRWFGERTIQLTLDLVQLYGGPNALVEAQALVAAGFDQFRRKCQDLVDFMRLEFWREKRSAAPKPVPYGSATGAP